MEITYTQDYLNLQKIFKEKGYSRGTKDTTPIYYWDGKPQKQKLTPSHYVCAIRHKQIKFSDVPEKYRTREFFLHALSSGSVDIVNYVKSHPEKFNKNFFKDHIETNSSALHYQFNDFEIMPLEYIDEEMVACALFKTMDGCLYGRSNATNDWFYSICKRKKEVLTQEVYTLEARCFAINRHDIDKFLNATPQKYRTKKYYFNLCSKNPTPIMEYIPKNILTSNFLAALIADDPKNIQCFTESALEQTDPTTRTGLKFWQIAVMRNGYVIDCIPLNEEKIKFFLEFYDKDSYEYEDSFKEHYKAYLRAKDPTPKQEVSKISGMMTLATAMSGASIDTAIEAGNNAMNALTDNQKLLPISFRNAVPKKYCKIYDKEEYLAEIYKKLNIEIIREEDSYYYRVILPEGLSIVQDDFGYSLQKGEETLLHYYDRGPFYDRTVTVDMLYVTL